MEPTQEEKRRALIAEMSRNLGAKQAENRYGLQNPASPNVPEDPLVREDPVSDAMGLVGGAGMARSLLGGLAGTGRSLFGRVMARRAVSPLGPIRTPPGPELHGPTDESGFFHSAYGKPETIKPMPEAEAPLGPMRVPPGEDIYGPTDAHGFFHDPYVSPKSSDIIPDAFDVSIPGPRTIPDSPKRMPPPRTPTIPADSPVNKVFASKAFAPTANAENYRKLAATLRAFGGLENVRRAEELEQLAAMGSIP